MNSNVNNISIVYYVAKPYQSSCLSTEIFKMEYYYDCILVIYINMCVKKTMYRKLCEFYLMIRNWKPLKPLFNTSYLVFLKQIEAIQCESSTYVRINARPLTTILSKSDLEFHNTSDSFAKLAGLIAMFALLLTNCELK